MANVLKIMQHVNYNSDNGFVQRTRLATWRTIAGGFVVAAPEVNVPKVAHGQMRHVVGHSPDGHSCTLPIFDAAHPLFVNGGSFTDAEGVTFTVTSAIGERRLDIGAIP